ncbi:DNA polymerase alpha catalytic subunit-like [Ostrea edulis]|uniref:DNA polymerase alpha catalytic subunit-like n=1 Tax=Ostrea edulis TaxID=37623 RepID=UPI0024AEF43A|nr:DNA polymerase alpha catalytic subunit-like [Ostrea edulis]
MAPAPENDSRTDDQDDTIVADQGLAKSRSRREKKDKGGRFAALEKLKKAKQSGEKHKYDVEEEKNVYDVVNEDEYSEIVRQRQDDDWIVDDDGAGYVEDGREIFDDDLNEDPTVSKGKKEDKKKSKNPNIVRPGTKPKTTIKSMFAAQTSTGGSKLKSEKDVSLANDDLLGDLMEELHQGPSEGMMKPLPIKLKKKGFCATKSPLNPFNTNVPSTGAQATKKKTVVMAEPRTPLIKSERRPLPKPNIPEPEEAMDEVDSMTVGVEITTKTQKDADIQHLSDSQDDAALMDLNDMDFEEDLVIKKEETVVCTSSVKPKTAIGSIPSETLSTGWENYQNDSQEESAVEVKVDTSELPLVTSASGDQVLRFFWLDAYEDPYNNPGTVFLFGKVWIEKAKVYVSCCVTVKNIERRMYVLPRATRKNTKTGNDTGVDVTLVDVYTEFNEKVAEKFKIPKFKSKKITKQYAFEKTDVPVESDYLEIRYGAEIPPLPRDLEGDTFSHVFGTHTSCLELLLIDSKMKGPGWLDLKFPHLVNPPVSWCKIEVSISKTEHLLVTNDQHLTPPPLVVMTLNLRTLPNHKTHQNEIVAATCLVQEKFNIDKPAPKNPFQQHFCVLTKPSDSLFPFDFREKLQKEGKKLKVEMLPTERALMGFILAKIHKVDPDVIVGHDIFGFDLDLILHRINANKVPHWSKIGRLKRTKMPKLSGPGHRGFADKSAACGRLVCDIKLSAKELIRSRSYDLTELTNVILKAKRQELDYDQIHNMYLSSQQLLQLLELTLMDSTYILRILFELNVLPLGLQITNICGNVMTRTLLGGRSERNEYLLLHAFTEKNFIVPDKEYKKTTVKENMDDFEADDGGKGGKSSGRRKPAYAGGLVLDPKKGFYDKYILLLDFNSLYPSIIQEFNICFTTVSRTAVQQGGQDDEDQIIELPDKDLEPGILPTEIRKLVESRRQVKQLMKGDISNEQYMQYDIRQKALKLTANSMYGCLGFSHSRFFAKPLAALVTAKGREILMKTKDLVQTMNLEVIYGDTDSIMINTNCNDIDAVYKVGNKVKSEVNKLYRLLEIDIDGVFKSMLLLKKKKYAALSISKGPDGKYTEHKELKGLDIVRRDWSDLAKEAGNYVVEQILSGDSRETIVENIHTKLMEVGEKVRNGKVAVELYHITKQLTKNPEDYPDKKSLPHVQVALRVNSKGGKKMKAGDTVAYIICEDGSSLAASQRAYHPEELAKSDTLTVDTKYYLSQQVHPVVSRLCDPIEGTDAAHLAECLGLDPSGYKHAVHYDEEEEALMNGTEISDEEKYRDCERFKFVCPGATCSREIIVDAVFMGAEEFTECSVSICPNKECRTDMKDHVPYISNRLQMDIRRHIQKYYQGWLKCEDAACGTVTRKVPLTFQRGHPVCHACHRGLLHPLYTDTMLYTQLCFYEHIFDAERALKGMTDGSKEKCKL